MRKKFVTALFLIFFAIAAYPQTDLIWYGSIEINPAAPATGNVVTFTATVKATLGNSQPFQVVGGIDGVQLLSTAGPALVKATKKAFSFSWTAVTGNHTVYFDIDPNQTSGDINLKNNHIEANFVVDSGSNPPPPPPRRRNRDQLPNLVIKNVTLNPQSFNQNDKLDFQITVANIGSSPTPISYATLEINGTTFNSCMVDVLQPGDADTVPATAGIANGCPIKVIIRADANNSVTESNEGDNEWIQTINCAASIIEPDPLPVTTDIGRPPKRHRGPGDPKLPHFTIAGTPNLIVTDVDWSPKNFNDNQKVTLTYTIQNIGNGPAEPSPSVSVSRGNSTKVNAPGAPGTSVPAGWSKKSVYIWNATCGDKIVITVDPGNITNESNETDNSWEHTFGPPHCTPTFIPEPPAKNLPNLNISSSRFRHLQTSWNTGTVYNFDTGDISVDLSITVKNSGNVTAPASKYQLLVNNQVIITDYITLGANQQVKLGWYATVSCGSIFKLILDVDNSVEESSELDNSTTIGPWPICK